MEIIKKDQVTKESFYLQQKAELDQKVSTAKAYPRNLLKVVEEAKIIATMSEEIAKSCFYCKPVGENKEAEGCSVRLAEIIAASWGNTRGAFRQIENDGKQITVEAVFWDMEKNNESVTQAKKSIIKRTGERYSLEQQSVIASALGSIALRNAIFKVIPKSIIETVATAAKDYLIENLRNSKKKANVGDGDSFDEKVQKAIRAFAFFGISEQELLICIGKDCVENITPEDVVDLQGLYVAIKEKHFTVEEVLGYKVNLKEKGNKAKSILETIANKNKEG